MNKIISTTAAIALLATTPVLAQVSASTDVGADAGANVSTQATDLAADANSNIGGTAGADTDTDTNIAAGSTTGANTGSGSLSVDGQATTDTQIAETGTLNAEGETELFTAADIETINADDLVGAEVFSVEAEKVGEVETVVRDNDGKVASVVLNVGGFLGIGEKPVEVPAADLKIEQNADAKFRVSTNFTEDELEAMEEFQGDS